MASFELIYEEDEDVLEVTFVTFDENFARTIALNDNIVLYTDTEFKAAWGLTLYSYAQLLQVSETHLDGLRPLDGVRLQKLLRLISMPPISCFLQMIAVGELRALVKAPNLEQLLQG
jgi:hypothetical protein